MRPLARPPAFRTPRSQPPGQVWPGDARDRGFTHPFDNCRMGEGALRKPGVIPLLTTPDSRGVDRPQVPHLGRRAWLPTFGGRHWRETNNQAMLAKVLSGIVVRRHRSHTWGRQRPGPPPTLDEIRHKQIDLAERSFALLSPTRGDGTTFPPAATQRRRANPHCMPNQSDLVPHPACGSRLLMVAVSALMVSAGVWLESSTNRRTIGIMYPGPPRSAPCHYRFRGW